MHTAHRTQAPTMCGLSLVGLVRVGLRLRRLSRLRREQAGVTVHVLESLNEDFVSSKLVLYSVRRTGCRIGLRFRRQPGGLRRVSSVSGLGYGGVGG